MLATPLPEEPALFGGYRLAAYDEMFEAAGRPRPHYRALHDRLLGLSPEELERRHRLADLSMRQQGITFTVYGREQGVERIIPFDPIPRLVDADEWSRIERGPGAARPGAEPVHRTTSITIGRSSGTASSRPSWSSAPRGIAAQCVGLRVPRDVYIHVSGIDLIRDDRRPVPRPGGQLPDALGRQLRPQEPRR